MSITTHSQLAVNGGDPVRRTPWVENLTMGEAERKAVLEVMDRGFLSLFEGSHEPAEPFSFWGGPRIRELERAWCDYYEFPFAVSVNSATSGLMAAVGALGIGYGDEVVVSPFSMTACASCVLLYGAVPIFADVDPKTGCLDPEDVKRKITPRTKSILVVHQFGNVADMHSMMHLAREHQLYVIEDCAQAHGAKHRGQWVGTIGDIGVFSLNVNKAIQSGEGGICLTHDADLRDRLALIRNHGEAVVGPAKHENITNILGFNFRLTELQAAVAIEQLKKLEQLNHIRIEFAQAVREALDQYPCFSMMLPRQNPHRNTCYIFPFRYDPIKNNGISRQKIVRVLNAEGMRFREGYVEPLYLQPLYQRKHLFKHGYPFTAPENRGIRTNYHRGACPAAEKLHFEEMISTSVLRYPHTRDDIEDVLKAIRKVMTCLIGAGQC